MLPNEPVREEENEITAMPELPQRKPGGLYRNVKMSVKTANLLVLILAAALLVSIFVLTRNNGFTVSFDTDGGSQVESMKVYYGDTFSEPEQPVKEGYVFTGWYTDRAATEEWSFETDTAQNSMTLYAGWQKRE